MKIVLNIATHGDETIGLAVADKLRKLKLPPDILTVQIANKKAFKLQRRYIDQDLNRSFPGKKFGNYEEKLAYKLSPIIKSADIVIDIHSTTSMLKDTLIITNLNKKTREYIQAIQPKYVLLMNVTKNNALISQAKIGIAFEYGKDKDQLALSKTVDGIERLFSHLNLINKKLKKKKTSTSFFNVVSIVEKPAGYKLVKGIRNYSLILKGTIYAHKSNNVLIAKEDFYPILFGEKKYKNYFGFMGKKLI